MKIGTIAVFQCTEKWYVQHQLQTSVISTIKNLYNDYKSTYLLFNQTAICFHIQKDNYLHSCNMESFIIIPNCILNVNFFEIL